MEREVVVDIERERDGGRGRAREKEKERDRQRGWASGQISSVSSRYFTGRVLC